MVSARARKTASEGGRAPHSTPVFEHTARRSPGGAADFPGTNPKSFGSFYMTGWRAFRQHVGQINYSKCLETMNKQRLTFRP